MREISVEPTWKAYLRARHAYDDLKSQQRDVQSLRDIETCLEGLVPFAGMRLLRIASLDCGSPIIDLRAADVDGDERIEILAATADCQAFCLKVPLSPQHQWEKARDTIPSSPDTRVLGLSLYEDEVGHKHASVLLRERDTTLSRAIHVQSGPFQTSVRQDSHVIEPFLIVPRREGYSGRSADVLTAPVGDSNFACLLRVRARSRTAAFDWIYQSPFNILAVTYDDRGIFWSDTSPALCYLSFEKIRQAHDPLLPEWRVPLDCGITSLQFLGDRSLLGSSLERGVYCFDTRNGHLEWNDPEVQDLLALDSFDLYEKPKSCIATGNADGRVSIYGIIAVQETTQCIEDLFEMAAHARTSTLVDTLANYMNPPHFPLALEAFRQSMAHLEELADTVQAQLVRVQGNSAYLSVLELEFERGHNRSFIERMLRTAFANATPPARAHLLRTAARISRAGHPEDLEPIHGDARSEPAAAIRLSHVWAARAPISALDALASDSGMPWGLYATVRGTVGLIDWRAGQHILVAPPEENPAKKIAGALAVGQLRFLALGDTAGRLELWSLAPSGEINTLITARELGHEILGIQIWSERGEIWVAAYGENWARVLLGSWEQKPQVLEEVSAVRFPFPISHAVFRTDDQSGKREWVATSPSARNILIMDWKTQEPNRVIRFSGMPLTCGCLKEDRIVVACADHFVCCVNSQGELEWRVPAGAGISALDICDIDGDGQPEILLGTVDGCVRILTGGGDLVLNELDGPRVIALRGLVWRDGRSRGILLARADNLIELVELALPTPPDANSLPNWEGLQNAVQNHSDTASVCRMLNALPATLEPTGPQQEILYALAAVSQVCIQREIVRLARRVLTRHPPGDGDWVWKLLRVCSSEPDHEWVFGEIAGMIRDVFKGSPVLGWQFANQAMNHGISPSTLHTLASGLPPMLIDPVASDLLDKLGTWMAQSGDPVRVQAGDAIRALKDLASAIERAQQSRLLPWDDAYARVYTTISRMAGLREVVELRQFLLVDNSILEIVEWMGQNPTLLFEHLAELLEELQKTVAVGMRYPADSIQGLERLIQDLEAWRARTRHRNEMAGPPLWPAALIRIVGDWLAETGALGGALHALRHDFSWDLVVVDPPRVVDDEIQVSVRISNTSRVTGYDLSIGPVKLSALGQELQASLEPPSLKTITQLDPNKNFTILVHAKIFSQLIRQKAELELAVTLSYFVPPNQSHNTRAVKVRLAGGVEFEIDYMRDFPSAWARHEGEVRKHLRSRQHLLMVELERAARQSFFRAMANIAQDARPVLIDLRDIYRVARGKNLEVRPKHLQLALARRLWENNADLLDEVDDDYRDGISHGLRLPGAPDLLLLDHLDYLVDELLETPDGRNVLGDTLEFWRTLTRQQGIRIVLGGSYLVRKILSAQFPGFYAELAVLRAEEVMTTPGEREEMDAFLRRTKLSQRLADTTNLFAAPLTVDEFLDITGGNLQFIRVFGLDALEQAGRLAQTIEGKKRLAAMNPQDYLLEFSKKSNFFAYAWVWLTFYEKIALILASQGEFSLERGDWVDDCIGFKLSRDFFPGASGGRRSPKMVAQRWTVIDKELASKIRSDRFFSPNSVWIGGISTQRTHLFEQDPTARMLWRLLDAVGRDLILRRMVDEGILRVTHRSSTLGEVYEFRVPLLRTWFRHNDSFEQLKKVGRGDGGDWALRDLWLDQRANSPRPLLYLDRPFEITVSGQIPIEDLPKIDRALHQEDYVPFYNFYGIGGRRTQEPIKRWRNLVELTQALVTYRDGEFPPEQATTTRIFKGLENLLDIRSADLPPGLGPKGASFRAIGSLGLIWQYSDFVQVYRSFNKEMLFGVIRDGKQFDEPAVTELKKQARELVMACAKAKAGDRIAEEPRKETRLVVILLILDHFGEFWELWQRDNHKTDVHFVLLDPKAWAEVCAAPDTRKRLLGFAYQRVGWRVFSPYQFTGNLDPGSGLFVGRQAEIGRIVSGVRRQNFVILGSRKMGKTSLLRQLEYRLKADPTLHILAINFVSTAKEFFERLRYSLPAYDELRQRGVDEYEAMRLVFDHLAREEQKLPLILLDEVDKFYRWDQMENGERFFMFLRDLTQSVPRLCSVIMTGYQRIFFALQTPSSAALYNFCEPLNIAEVESDSAKELIKILREDIGVEFYSQQGATEFLLERTYCVPYLLQRACHGLLARLDQYKRSEGRIEKEDVDAVLTEEIDTTLYGMLFEDIGKETEEGLPIVDELLQQQLRIMLLCIVLGKYPFVTEQSGEYRRLQHEERGFTADQVVEFMDSWADKLKPYWTWTRDTIDTYLRALTLTLDMAMETRDQQVQYNFPLDILPTVLDRYYRNQKKSTGRHGDILEDLDERIEKYIQLVETSRRRIR